MEYLRNLIKFLGLQDVTLVSTWERDREFLKKFELTDKYIDKFKKPHIEW
jgi:FMN-dependent NADH-azoreductase